MGKRLKRKTQKCVSSYPEILRNFYDKTASERDIFRSLHPYYHEDALKYYRYLIPPHSNVLEVGCSTGDLLAQLDPKRGVGIDISPRTILLAKRKYPNLSFYIMNAEDIELNGKFDYVILSGLIADLDDVQSFLVKLKKNVHPRTRIIIDHYNYLWQPILRLAERIGLKTPQFHQNWLPTKEIENLLQLSGYEIVRVHSRLLLPIHIPVFSAFINGFLAKLPVFRLLCLNRFLIARPLEYLDRKEHSCSVIVPARNEKGTIEEIVCRIPHIGKKTEIIFVEGHSTDGTREEIIRVKKKYFNKNIKIIVQKKNKGKADAARMGFDSAAGEIIIILDADLSVAPEDLPKFYHLLVSGQAEFANGSRLVYSMEKGAMRFLNLLGNYLFSVLFSWLLEIRITDTLCGTKAVWRKDYRSIKRIMCGFGDFDPFGDFELLFGANKLNFKTIDVPVRYKARVYGKTNISRFKDALLLFKMCWIAFWKLKLV